MIRKENSDLKEAKSSILCAKASSVRQQESVLKKLSVQDKIYAELDQNDKPISAGNRIPKDDYNKILDDSEMYYNTIEFILSKGKIMLRQRSERM
ncbi:MAG TPA: hypothetical protein VJ729_00365 [Nitrososphaeraceae archaeon]|nr:hypothetical protein [Nitrososphaeraceae archaeon]